MTRKTVLSAWLLGGLFLMVFVAVVATPSVEKGRPYSSYSAGADGLRLARDLIDRLGWNVEARERPFSDTLEDPAPVQVLVNSKLAASETRSLLAFVRGGGSLLLAGGSGGIFDSLGLSSRTGGVLAEVESSPRCVDRRTFQAQIAPEAYAASIDTRRPLASDTVGFGTVVTEATDKGPARRERAALGMPWGAGRIVVVADEGFVTNDVIRRCELEADADFVRIIEYLSRNQRGVRVAFDEYQHGYGVTGGSFVAIRMYLQGTPSGRMLAQMTVAGLLLLFAAAPRPLAPRDPPRAARRSPLEHADALAHAYAGVNASRTVTARLLAGVRRRTRARSRARDTDQSFLASAAAVSPAAAKAAEVVAIALDTPVSARELPEVASALDTIERELTTRSSSTPR